MDPTLAPVAYRPLGQSGIQISSILMGTWQAGRRMWADIDDDQTIRAIREGFEAGITTVDTAEVYGEGYSEQIVARALKDARDRAVYASKVFANHLKYDQVIEACERSLKNLETDYLDLYQIHWPAGSFNSERVPVEETLRAMNELKAQGKIRAIGLSNFSREQLEEACQYAQIDSLQPPYSLFWRFAEADAIPFCRERGITVLAYSPMAQGLLTGKFGPDHQFAEGDHRAKSKLFEPETYQRVQAAIAELRPIADRLGISLANLALAWVTSQPNTCAIAGARNPEQAVENAKALAIRLDPVVWNEMDAIGRPVTDNLEPAKVMWNFG